MAINDNPQVDYERSDVSPWLIAALAGGVVAIVVISLFALKLSFPLHQRPIHQDTLPPAPRLQIDSHADLKAYRDGEEARLNGYGWVDKAKGIVHIPIDQAMQDIAKEGAPQWP